MKSTSILIALLAVFKTVHGVILYDDSLSLNQKRLDFVENVLEKKADQKYCSPSGLIQDCGCDFESVERTNKDVNRQLESLIKNDFFKYYKIDLFRECPFWREDGLCGNRACAVETEDDLEIPEEWRAGRLSQVNLLETESGPFAGCHFRDSDFCILDDEADSEGEWVDLGKNPERFTGYAGPSAERVWQSIYQENCFDIQTPLLDPNHRAERCFGFPKLFGDKLDLAAILKSLVEPWTGKLDILDSESASLEKRVFYRLISGLHASISIHICDEYLDQTTGLWSPNLECFISRIGSHPERLQNLYFTYVLLLRSLKKIGPHLMDYDYSCTTKGPHVSAENQMVFQPSIDPVQSQIMQLVQTSNNCPSTFDETAMFTAPGAENLKGQFKDHFRNVSRIMDCVGCDKCKLWGKLQITGLGTALKILFSYGKNDLPELSRSEIVAFVWTLSRFSRSLEAVEDFRTSYQKRTAASHVAASGKAAHTSHESQGNGRSSLFADAREISDSLPKELPYHIASPDDLLTNLPEKPKEGQLEGDMNMRPRRSWVSTGAKRRSLAKEVLENFAHYGRKYNIAGAETAFVIGGLLLLVMTLFAAVSLKRKRRSEKNVVLLVGLSGAGKTRLFCQLQFHDCPQTQTSMTSNEGWITMEYDETSSGKARQIKVIDIPGHPKLRNVFKQHVGNATKGLVFVVDAPTAIRNSRALSEFLYDLLTCSGTQSFRTPVLIAVSSRAVEGSALSLPSESQLSKIRSSLEAEMTKLRTSRTSTPSSLGALSPTNDVADEETSDQFLGYEGRDFSFDHVENTVKFVACSIGHPAGIAPIVHWIALS